MYICIYIYIYRERERDRRDHICGLTRPHPLIHRHAHLDINHTRVYTFAYTHARTPASTCSHTHTHAHSHMHVHGYTRNHLHVQTCARLCAHALFFFSPHFLFFQVETSGRCQSPSLPFACAGALDFTRLPSERLSSSAAGRFLRGDAAPEPDTSTPGATWAWTWPLLQPSSAHPGPPGLLRLAGWTGRRHPSRPASRASLPWQGPGRAAQRTGRLAPRHGLMAWLVSSSELRCWSSAPRKHTKAC